MIARPEGIILVTGPTGSGKTTTLYSVLNHINSEGIHIMTLEDPVEYPMALVRQTSVAETAKLDFANGIRSMMRQDPDVILVGEIRDAETAEMAFRAAMTGHQVFSTLHTNSAIGAIPRLLDIGVLPDIMAGNIIGIVAQRLIRRLCDPLQIALPRRTHEMAVARHAPMQPAPGAFSVPCRLRASATSRAIAAALAIMELLRIDGDIDELIARRATTHEIRNRGLRRASVRWPTTACAASSTARPRSRNSAASSTSPTGCSHALRLQGGQHRWTDGPRAYRCDQYRSTSKCASSAWNWIWSTASPSPIAACLAPARCRAGS
jgi:type II secretory ATPase GspE/PulE/Tfp pilus assembly ATPase PilB-like protein